MIVGAGPAGLAAARELAENERMVAVFERNAVVGSKVCAGGLTGKDYSLVPEKIWEKPFNEVKLHSRWGENVVRSEKPIAITVDRKNLGRFQCKQAEEAGAEVFVESEVKKIGGECIELAGGENVEFDRLIGADGSGSLVRRSLGIPIERIGQTIQYRVEGKFDFLELFFDYRRFGPWYAWVFPHKNHAFIGTGCDPAFVKMQGLRKNFDEWLNEKFGANLKEAVAESAPINYDCRGFEFGKSFLAGDAAGLTSGLTGEGIYSAMVSGEEVAKKIVNPSYACPRINALLKTKKKHERLLWFTKACGPLADVGFELFVRATASKRITKKLIGLFA